MQYYYNTSGGGYGQAPQAPTPQLNVPQHLQPLLHPATVAIGQILNASASENPARKFLLMSAAGNAGNWATPIFEQLLTMTLECVEFWAATSGMPPQNVVVNAAKEVCKFMSLSLAKSNPAIMFEMERIFGSQGLANEIARVEQEFRGLQQGIQQFRNGAFRQPAYQQPAMSSSMQQNVASVFNQHNPWNNAPQETGTLSHHAGRFAGSAAPAAPELSLSEGWTSAWANSVMETGFGTAMARSFKEPEPINEPAPKLTEVKFEERTLPSGFVAQAVVPETTFDVPSHHEEIIVDTAVMEVSDQTILEEQPQLTTSVTMDKPLAIQTIGTVFDTRTHVAVTDATNSQLHTVEIRRQNVKYEEHETVFFFQDRDEIEKQTKRDFAKAAAEFHRLNEERSAELLVANHEEKHGSAVDFAFKEHDVVSIDMVVHTTGNEDSAMVIASIAHASFGNMVQSHTVHLRYIQVMRELFLEEAASAVIHLQKAETIPALIEELRKTRTILNELQWAIISDAIKQKINDLLTIEIPIDITIDSVYDDLPMLPDYIERKFDSYMRNVVEKGLLEAVKAAYIYTPYFVLSGTENASIEFLFENEVDGEKEFDKNFGGVVGCGHDVVLLNLMSNDLTLAYVGNCGLLLPSRHPELHETILKLLNNRMPGTSKIEFRTRDNKRFSAYLGRMVEKSVILRWE